MNMFALPVLASLGLLALAGPGHAAPSGADLFAGQCAACHAIDKAAGPRMGPNLAGVYGRKAGSAPGFHYTAGFGKADFTWDEPHLQAWLTNPQAVISGTIMIYHQPDAVLRTAIIGYLKTKG
jgi:cytochrome c